MKIRMGHGYDVHRLVEGRPLFLGGVRVPYERGLLGHSDADCLLHAIMDAVLGALGKRDIGYHFPDTDARFAGADSAVLAAEVATIMRGCGYRIGNIDATVITQRPKLSPYRDAMCARIASIFGCRVEDVNVKATTEEGLGFTGSGEAIAVHAVCVLVGV
ncbi:MAG: 2-C-methyl-D-erythritol 2,4-cyclodiphosphate synthase [Clostridia bacterium]|nr:2-C-methyl-D-erythritol 2,4-cyclodiphosphate synthase [Clostridia bacterium]